MLLLHQAGSVKIGEVVRYTVTYTPARDRILPSPPTLSLKIKNSSALALRAAFIHGPYTLYAAAYPSTFSPNTKFENPRREGVPEFEPNLKAGGSFTCELKVPADVRESAGTSTSRSDGRVRGDGGEEVKSVSWIIEVSSQVIFSTSAAVHYEILLGRDERSLSLGVLGNSGPTPGQISDHQQSQGAKDGHHSAQPKGVYSKAIQVTVDDTASLWNTPRMPEWDEAEKETGGKGLSGHKNEPIDSVMEGKDEKGTHRAKRQKKVHLVVLTHGLHSNLGADMLYLKESIDAAAKQAKIDAKTRRAKEKESKASKVEQEQETQGDGLDGDASKSNTQQREDEGDDTDDEEEVIVRGFSGNAVRTERGIKYLGKRLAKYVLTMTYPDQPYRPVTKSAANALSHALKQDSPKISHGESAPTHKDSTIIKSPQQDHQAAYKITSISFIAHSLGGLIQTYAVAYIQKHSPQFFDIIKPINFIAMASPFLGLSNENPLYVKFALDFGLVGRTGQDLGLTWRAPTIARSGWGAIVGNIGESAHKRLDGETAPEAKPLLRILPTGPAHTVLKKFRNRTVYSNVVNDGIVPLRTSCLLFLDWQGLGRVEKARRENGLVGTMAGWGWAEITGANSNYSNSPRRSGFWSEGESDTEETGNNTPTRQGHGLDVPQPPADAAEDDVRSLKSAARSVGSSAGSEKASTSPNLTNNNPLTNLFGFLKPNAVQKPNSQPKKISKIYKRSQTMNFGDEQSTSSKETHKTSPKQSKVTAGNDEGENPSLLSAPPKTTFFESAGDLLKPPLPPVEFLIDPSARPRTIFHDRVYHPSDIPPPPMKKRSTSLARRKSSMTVQSPATPSPGISHESSGLSTKDYDDAKNHPDRDPLDVIDGSAMKVEEKIARAYHRDLSWRKVLVRLEPDAHNNMIVRRMFANAHGWPVIKHLVDTHFSDAAVANTRDEDESNTERAKGSGEKADADGGEVNGDRRPSPSERTDSEVQEAADEVPALNSKPRPGSLGKALSFNRRPTLDSVDSTTWSERDWESGDDSDEVSSVGIPSRKPSEDKKGWNWTEAIVGKGAGASTTATATASSPKGTEQKDIDDFLRGARAQQQQQSRPLSSDGTGLGLNLNALSPSTDEESVTARVARLSVLQGNSTEIGDGDGDGSKPPPATGSKKD